MPIKTVRISSISGNIIPDEVAVMVRFDYVDGRPSRKMDVSEEEVAELIPHSDEVRKRPERGRSRSRLGG